MILPPEETSSVISIHALLAESDISIDKIPYQCQIFLSTLSLRRATSSLDDILAGVNISIHALLAESDLGNVVAALPMLRFLSTLSLRRATQSGGARICKQIEFLSTLSLRRATKLLSISIFVHTHFYPRSPCGERPLQHWILVPSALQFLSTLSLRRATGRR